MDNTINNYNPKALNLDAIRNSPTKVTLGFKCEPELKLQLAEDAAKHGLTLSSYVEMRLLLSDDVLLDNPNEGTKKLKANVEQLEYKVNFYENSILVDLFKKYQNQVVPFKNLNGENVNLRITDIKDVFTIMINSFK